jgi:predicted nucleic acid-binding protein
VSEEKASPIIVDANSLIDLIKLGALIAVTQIVAYHLLVTEEVMREIRRPDQVRILRHAMERGQISRVSIRNTDELELFIRLQPVLDPGETASLAYASIHQCLFLSDETQRAFMREVRALIGEKRLVRTHTILAAAISSQALSFSSLKTGFEKLRKSASCPRDLDDI